MPRQTLLEWAKNNRRVTAAVIEIQHEKVSELTAAYRRAAGLNLAHASDPLVISALSGLDAMKASGIALDKAQLLDGLPTSITANVDRQELSVTLYSCLAELEEMERLAAIDVAPESDRPQDIALLQR